MDIVVFLSDGYIEKGWGPDLRVRYYDKDDDHYDAVNSIMFLVDDKLYTFSNFEESGDSGIIFCGTVMQSFLNSLMGAKEIALQLSHTNQADGSNSATIDPVKLNALLDFIALAQLFEAANVWDPEVTTDLMLNDMIYGASVE